MYSSFNVFARKTLEVKHATDARISTTISLHVTGLAVGYAGALRAPRLVALNHAMTDLENARASHSCREQNATNASEVITRFSR